MTIKTDKVMTKMDAPQTLRGSFNEVDFSLTTTGFLTGVVGRRVEIETAGAVETYTFIENGVTLYEITVTYTDSSREQMVSAERTA